MIKTSKRVKKDLNKRFKYKRVANQTIILKTLMKNENLPINLRHYARYKLSKLGKNVSISKINNYCVLSNNFKAIDNIVTIDNNSKLIHEKHKSNLIVESDDNKVKSYEENEEEGSVRIFPQEEEKYIKSLPNVNTNGQVILRKL